MTANFLGSSQTSQTYVERRMKKTLTLHLLVVKLKRKQPFKNPVPMG